MFSVCVCVCVCVCVSVCRDLGHFRHFWGLLLLKRRPPGEGGLASQMHLDNSTVAVVVGVESPDEFCLHVPVSLSRSLFVASQHLAISHPEHGTFVCLCPALEGLGSESP